jgi:hypothetical protein
MPLRADSTSEDELSTIFTTVSLVESNIQEPNPKEVDTADLDASWVLIDTGKSLHQAAEDFLASLIPAIEVATQPIRFCTTA